MGFFHDAWDFFNIGQTDEAFDEQNRRDQVAQNMAKKDSQFVMGQVGFYAAVAGILIITVIVAYKKL
jgi:hypothetical protein